MYYFKPDIIYCNTIAAFGGKSGTTITEHQAIEFCAIVNSLVEEELNRKALFAFSHEDSSFFDLDSVDFMKYNDDGTLKVLYYGEEAIDDEKLYIVNCYFSSEIADILKRARWQLASGNINEQEMREAIKQLRYI